jgi:hypothetical protein
MIDKFDCGAWMLKRSQLFSSFIPFFLDRRFYVFPFSPCRVRETKVLLIGLGGVNSEVCKNLVLAGVQSVTILESEKVTPFDLSSHLFVSMDDVGKNVFTFLFPFPLFSPLNALQTSEDSRRWRTFVF